MTMHARERDELIAEARHEIAKRDTEIERLRAASDGYKEQVQTSLDAMSRLTLRFKSILEWHQNWDAPFHDDDEWREDYRLAREELGLVPRAAEQSAREEGK